MSTASLPTSLVLVGAGKMGGAMLQGWLSLGLAGRAVTVMDPFAGDEMTALCVRHGLALNPPVATVAAPQVLVLAIKPQMLDEAAPGIAPMVGADTLVVSILAGKTIGNITARLPAKAVARAMPNTPAAVGRGITGVAANAATTPAQRAMADALLQAIGQVVWVDDEALIDAVTAVSGSGPAYVFHLVEAMAAAGEQAGLPADVALKLARATIEGSGELLFREPGTSAAQLRKNVTSPGGTTAAALEVLMGPEGLTELMGRAVAAAKRRAGELSG